MLHSFQLTTTDSFDDEQAGTVLYLKNAKLPYHRTILKNG